MQNGNKKHVLAGRAAEGAEMLGTSNEGRAPAAVLACDVGCLTL